MDRFFVYKPVFAWVIAAFIALAGVIGLIGLPIEQYPQVAPPALNLAFTYNGADAETLDRNVTSVIEREMNGIDGFLYMNSTSRSNGTAQITLTFQSGTDLNTARVEVQDRLNRAEPRLPEDVRRLGIQITDNTSGFLMVVALTSKNGTLPVVELGNYAANNVVNELRRVEGVGDVQLFGSQYAMRIWLDPENLRATASRLPRRWRRFRSRTARPQAVASVSSRSRARPSSTRRSSRRTASAIPSSSRTSSSVPIPAARPSASATWRASSSAPRAMASRRP